MTNKMNDNDELSILVKKINASLDGVGSINKLDKKTFILSKTDKNISIVITSKNDPSFSIEQYNKLSSKYKLVIIYDPLSDDSINISNNIETLFINKTNYNRPIDNNEIDMSFLSIGESVKNYFEILINEKNLFKEVQVKADEYSEDGELTEYTPLKISSIWYNYIQFNKIKKIWLDQELDCAEWERALFNARMVTMSIKFKFENANEQATFIPCSNSPDSAQRLNELKKNSDAYHYFFERYKRVDFIISKRRYLEFIIFTNNKVKRSNRLLELPELLENEVSFIKTHGNSSKSNYIEYLKVIGRYLEVLNLYYEHYKSKPSYLTKRIDYLSKYIDETIKNTSFKEILFFSNFLLNSSLRIIQILDKKIDDLSNALFRGAGFFKKNNECCFQRDCYNLILKIKKNRNETFEIDFCLGKSFYYEARTRSCPDPYKLILLNQAITSFKKSSHSLSNKKEAEVKQLYKEYNNKMKPIKWISHPVKISIKELNDANRHHLSTIKEKENIDDRIDYLFKIEPMFSIDEILGSKGNNGTIYDMFPTITMGPLGPVGSTLSKSEDNELKIFKQYNEMPYHEKRIFQIRTLFNDILSESLISFEDILNYLKLRINDDDFLFFEESLLLFEKENYASSVYTIFHLVERRVRSLTEFWSKHLSHRDGNVEYGVPLDQMIQEVNENIFSKNFSMFLRSIFSYKLQMNLRNNLSHSLIPFNKIDKIYSTIIIWATLACYVRDISPKPPVK